jgi:hypothetical protein
VVLAARVATWTAARQNVFSPGGSRRDVDRSPTEFVLSWRLASRRGPQPLFGAPLLKVYAGESGYSHSELWPPSQVHTQ